MTNEYIKRCSYLLVIRKNGNQYTHNRTYLEKKLKREYENLEKRHREIATLT